MRKVLRFLSVFTVLSLFLTVLTIVTPIQGQAEPNHVLRLPPPNDNFAFAETLVLNKRTSTTGSLAQVTEEPLESSDPDLTSCLMYNTVWYKFTSPHTGDVALTTVGSRIDFGPYDYSNDTVIAVYTGTALSNLVQRACNDQATDNTAEIYSLPVVIGTTYFVRVGTYSITTPTGGVLKVLAMIKAATDFDPVGFQNKEFNEPIGTGWKVKNATNGDTRVCGTDCEFKFIGGPAEKTKLTQAASWPSHLFLARDGAVLDTSLEVRTTAPVDLKLQVVIVYADGTPSSKGSAVVTNVYSGYVDVGAPFTSPNVSKVKFTVTNRAPGGTAFVDTFYIDYDGGIGRAAVPGESVLPLPLPPQ